MAPAESSKQGAKRLQKEALSIRAALRNVHNTRVHIIERNSNEATHNETIQSSSGMLNTSTTKTQKSNKTRGPTRCNVVATASGKRREVETNERGQPIGESSSILSSYLGYLSRQMVPLNVEDWRKISSEDKEYYWEAIAQKFKFDDEDEGKHYALKKLGRLWSSYKSRLRRDPQKKPNLIDSDKWETFLKAMSSTKFKEKSKRFKALRLMQDVPYTGSRMGYARMEHKMKKESSNPSSISRIDVWCRAHTKRSGEPSNAKVAECMRRLREIKASQPPGSSTTSIRNDALSQVFGPERPGRVRGLGSGVAPSKLGAVLKTNGKVAKLEKELAETNSKMAETNERMAETNEKMAQMFSLMEDQQKLIETLMRNQGQRVDDEQNVERNTPVATTLQSQRGSNNWLKYAKCKLMDWMNLDEVVAIGRWETDDSSKLVHFVPLGNHASKVWVDVAEVPSAPLWRKTSDMEIIENVVGGCVAWPTDRIILMDD